MESQKKFSIPKTTSGTMTTSRPKVSRMPLKKGSLGSHTTPARLQSACLPTSSDTLDITIDRMASATLHDRSRPRKSDVNQPIAEQQDNVLERPSLSKRSFDNSHFTLESFDTIRTVGTGKSLDWKN